MAARDFKASDRYPYFKIFTTESTIYEFYAPFSLYSRLDRKHETNALASLTSVLPSKINHFRVCVFETVKLCICNLSGNRLFHSTVSVFAP